MRSWKFRRSVGLLTLLVFLLAACSGAPDASGDTPNAAGPDPNNAQDTAPQAVAWPGRIQSFGSQGVYDDYVDLLPEGAGDLGVAGATPAIESLIIGLRDGIGDQEVVHLWGEVECGVDDFTGCRLLVSDLHYGSTTARTHPVQGWQGQIVCVMQDGHCVPGLELAGDYPVHFGLSSNDASLQERLANMQDSPETVRIWGDLTAGAAGVYGTDIAVTRLEVDAASVSGP